MDFLARTHGLCFQAILCGRSPGRGFFTGHSHIIHIGQDGGNTLGMDAGLTLGRRMLWICGGRKMKNEDEERMIREDHKYNNIYLDECKHQAPSCERCFACDEVWSQFHPL